VHINHCTAQSHATTLSPYLSAALAADADHSPAAAKPKMAPFLLLLLLLLLSLSRAAATSPAQQQSAPLLYWARIER
jgi:hypothetical protein